MKTKISISGLFLGVIVSVVTSCEQSFLKGTSLTLDDAIEKTKKIWNQYSIVEACLDLIPANTVIQLHSFDINNYKTSEVSPSSDSWLIYMDMYPTANGGTHYKWLFVNAKNGKVTSIDTSDKPRLNENWSLEEYLSHVKTIKYTIPSTVEQESKTIEGGELSLSPVLQSAANDWAVIISGGANQHIN